MKDSTVAARYAKALFLATEKRAETARALDEVKVVAEMLAPGGHQREFFATPQIGREEKRRAIRQAFDGRALPIVIVFLELLLKKKRLRELPGIAVELEALVERARGVHRAHVVSATPLPEAERRRLARELERLTGGAVRVTEEVDPSLLGGALVRIGDRVIDRTVRTLLDSIGKQWHEARV